MKRFKPVNIISEIRLLSFKLMIIPVLTISIAFILLNVINFEGIFVPPTYRTSFEAYSGYTKGDTVATVELSSLKYTGYNIMKNDKVVSVYYYDLKGERCMFYKLDMAYDSVNDIPNELTNVRISAELVEPDGLAKNMMESFSLSIGWTYDGLSAITFPVIMDAHEYSPLLYYVLYGLIIIFLFYSLYLIACNLLLVIAPYLHPAFIKIKPYYKDTSYFSMIDNINDNFENNLVIKSGHMYITDKYFVNLGPHEICIMPLNQILLGYNHGQLISIFGIHIKMDHTLHFKGYKNVRISATRKKATHVTIITDYIRENYPDIIWGHTKENIKAYKQILATEKANKKNASEPQ